MFPGIFVSQDSLPDLVGVSDERTLKRVQRLQELLEDHDVRQGFDALLMSFGSPEGALSRARAMADQADGLKVLSAGALFGGLLAKPCLAVLGERADRGDFESRMVLRSIFDVRAIYPGSFDPMTLGHRDIAERAARVFDVVVIAVGINSGKKPFLSVDERIALIKEEVKTIPGTFIVETFDGLLAKFAARMNAGVLIRGVRGVTDLEVEKTIGEANRRQVEEALDLDTFFIPSRPEYENTSSSVVRELARLGGVFSSYVTPAVEGAVTERVKDEAFERFSLTPEYERLHGYWQKYIAMGADGVAAYQKLFRDIVREYTDPLRVYHNERHLLELFDRFDEAERYLKNPSAVVAAIFFHDVVYDTRRRDNEERSVEWFDARASQAGRGPAFYAATRAGILSSKTHTPNPEFPDTAYFIDMDLSILGASPERYIEYAATIREEFRWVEAERYREGRAEVLATFLARDTLYCSPWGVSRFQDSARRNIAAELRTLR